MESFSSNVIEKLGIYVYRLIDPRDGETFYVGKGAGNRVFMHAVGEIAAFENQPISADEDQEEPLLDPKIERIRAIRLAGLAVQHVIHRHGLDERTAYEVEAALMDAYPGLTNRQGGHGSGERGAMHAVEIVSLYEAPESEFVHDLLLISVAQSAEKLPLYEAVRQAWRISRTNAEKVDYVLAVRRGLIVGAFVAEKWLEHTLDNFPGATNRLGHPYYGFVGNPAPDDIQRRYVQKRVPEKYRPKKGEATPFRYIWARSRPRSD